MKMFNRYGFPSGAEIEQKQIELKLKRGLKYFDVNGTKILALNEKNAIRKYNNQNK